ncbi:MAG: cation diffusion facilitator family transporter [Candidatus Hydrogenedentes bacterium]|nr:cation diffusion facilitator family transporter [Candidatus Hydrogenedentota bacterium]
MGSSLLVAVLMLAGKLTAYFITGSTAILSDAAESVVHLVATSYAAFSMWYAQLPANRRHPYGHGKIAFFSAGFEGALILTAALFIVYEGVVTLISGPELRQLGVGILITGGLGVINLILGLSLVWVGKRKNAFILVANGKHTLTDMWTSLAVVGGVTIVWATMQMGKPILWLDPAVAIIAGLNIMVTAGVLIYRSCRGLLDEADPAHTRLILNALEEASQDGRIVGFHHLRHRQTDNTMWVEVHMLVPGDTTTAVAHRNVTQIENAIVGLFPECHVHVTTHVEPDVHDADHPGGHPDLMDAFAGGERRSRRSQN